MPFGQREHFLFISANIIWGHSAQGLRQKRKLFFKGKYVILKIKYESYGIKIMTTGGPYLEMNQKTFNFSTTSGKSRATTFKWWIILFNLTV